MPHGQQHVLCCSAQQLAPSPELECGARRVAQAGMRRTGYIVQACWVWSAGQQVSTASSHTQELAPLANRTHGGAIHMQ